MAVVAVESLAETMGRFPIAVEVDRPEFAEALADLGKARRFSVRHRNDLPLLAEPVRELYREHVRNEPFDAAIDVPGVTVDHLRAFADGAAAFREAAPWRFVDSGDFIEIGAPRPAPNVRFVSVLSEYGQLGLGFAESRDLFETDPDDDRDPVSKIANDAVWSVTYDEPWEVPVREHDLWLEQGFPTGPDETIPAAVQYGPKRRVRRASPKMLAFFEGIFRALAETTEDELDSGAWSKTVSTNNGPLSLQLSLPDILDPPTDSNGPAPFNPLRASSAMEEIQKLVERQSFESEEEIREFLDREVLGKELPISTPEGPRDEARALAIEAMDTPGRRGAAMARQALKLDPESPVAHLARAIHTRDRETAVERFREAVAVAERALGPEVFAEQTGEFWAIASTRPYMEARKGLADILWFTGQRNEAVDHYADLIRLNPNDNQGIRNRLAPAYLVIDDDEAAGRLLDAYADDPTAAPAFNRALLAFRQSGDSKVSREQLDRAFEVNLHVPDLLLEWEDLPDEPPDGYTIGSFEEAAIYFLEAEEAWRETPGALDWLEDALCNQGDDS
mgnify:CR=1 FL=1